MQLNIAITFLRLSQCTKRREDLMYTGHHFGDPTFWYLWGTCCSHCCHQVHLNYLPCETYGGLETHKYMTMFGLLTTHHCLTLEAFEVWRRLHLITELTQNPTPAHDEEHFTAWDSTSTSLATSKLGSEQVPWSFHQSPIECPDLAAVGPTTSRQQCRFTSSWLKRRVRP